MCVCVYLKYMFVYVHICINEGIYLRQKYEGEVEINLETYKKEVAVEGYRQRW